MELNELVKLKDSSQRNKKRLGRGYGSGKGGHTSGRGAKGDKARGTTKIAFSGTKTKKSWIKRLPLWRGKGRTSLKPDTVEISLDMIEKNFKGNEPVSLETLFKKKLIDFTRKPFGIKIIKKGKITKPFVVTGILCSAGAIQEIEKAGGKVSLKPEK